MQRSAIRMLVTVSLMWGVAMPLAVAAPPSNDRFSKSAAGSKKSEMMASRPRRCFMAVSVEMDDARLVRPPGSRRERWSAKTATRLLPD